MAEFFIDIEKGQIVQKRVVRKHFSLLADGSYKIKIEKGGKRTLPQNSFFHGILVPEFRKALNSVGYRIKNDEESKAVLKATFCTRHVENELTKEEMPIVQDTSKMNKEEMSSLIDEVIQFCSEHMSYIIPLPGEKLKFDFDEEKEYQ